MELYWENNGWEKEDKHLVGVTKMPFQRRWQFVDLRPGLYSLRGPRQIGKSSWLKHLLKMQCDTVGPKNCFFLSCENLADYKDLAEILSLYKNRKVIFLDEVTFVHDWARPVKHLIDRGFGGTIVVTGSNLHDLRMGVDRMPGRQGFGQDLLLLPMSFYEFKEARKNAGWAELSSPELLERYFRVGGFPLAVAEAGSDSHKTTQTEKLMEKWILGDIARIGKNENYAREILSQVGQCLCSSMSTQKLAARTQIGSHHTIADYLQVLEDMFILRTLYSIDQDTGALRFKKEKKYYLTDPIFNKLGWKWLGLTSNEIESDKMAEQMAHEFLRRHFDRMGFLSSKKNGEVDFYSYRNWAVEIKWSKIPTNLSWTYKNLQLHHKIIWNEDNYLELPADLATSP